MKLNRTYQIALLSAISMHVALALAFMIHPTTARPVKQLEAKHEVKAPEQEIVKAVAVNTKEVTEAVNKLKKERNEKAQAEARKQKKLAAEAEALRVRRVQEQRRLERLRAENARAAQKRKQEALAEQKHLKAMKAQKEAEARKLEVLKKEQLALKKHALMLLTGRACLVWSINIKP